eukprot:2052260-Pyramimonas_sp.AAC.1
MFFNNQRHQRLVPLRALAWGLGRPLKPARGRPGAFSGPPTSLLGRRTRQFGSCSPPGGHLGAVFKASRAILGARGAVMKP